nr:Chaperone DnaJ [Ipomoea batatas]
MAAMASLHTIMFTNSGKKPAASLPCSKFLLGTPRNVVTPTPKITKTPRSLTVVAAIGDVSDAGTTYLIAGAAAVALVGTAFPIFFSRKDTCPECDGAGFVRKAGATLRANAARKDQTQIVCARCNGLGKLNQIDK